MLVEYVSLYTSTFLVPGPHFHRPRRALVPPISPVTMVRVYSSMETGGTLDRMMGGPQHAKVVHNNAFIVWSGI